MCIWNRTDEVWFYKLCGATPKEWTASVVADPERPSLADALVSLHSTMKREAAKGWNADDTLSPSLEQMVTAAAKERDSRKATAAEAARRDEANNAFMEAAAEDQADAAEDAPERDMSRTCHTQKRDTVTCHAPVTLCETQTVAASPIAGNDLDAQNEDAKCHAFGHSPAPSSSISLCLSSPEEIKKENTTTSVAAPAERDPVDDILDRFLERQATTVDGRRQEAPQEEPERAKLKERKAELAQRFAAALGMTVEAVFDQWKNETDILRARLEAAGIDLKTGLPAGAHHEPADARNDIGMTTEPIAGDKPATGMAEPRGDGEFALSHRDIHKALRAQGIPSPVTQAPPAEDDGFGRNQGNVVSGRTAEACPMAP